MAIPECNCDAVVAMEELGVGASEILQYAGAILPRRELRELLVELQALLGRIDVAEACEELEQPDLCPST